MLSMRVQQIVLSAVCCLLLASCAETSGQGTENGATAARTAQGLFPLGDGYVWSYDVDTGTGLSTLAVVRSRPAGPNRFQIFSGSEPSLYEIRNGGIFRASTASWLLHDPIEMGTHWASGHGRTATITSVDEAVDCIAGHFAHCVEVTEQGGEDGRTLRTVYCPNVGAVVIESTMTMNVSHETVRVLAKLRGYQLGE